MRRARRRLALIVVFAPNVAAAAPVEGVVGNVASHWTDDGSRIVTEATVHTASGDVAVSQLGGTVDGLTMRTMPGPELLSPGMQVSVTTHEAPDLSQQMHVVVDDLRVLAYPEGFVRTGPTKAGHSLYWESGCVFVTVDAAGTTEIAGDAEFPVVDQCIATWNDDTAACSYLKVMSDGTKALEVGNDGVNLIKFRDTMWGRPATATDPPRMYNPASAGITTAVYVDDGTSPRDGAIVDADIELNGVNFAIALDGVSLGTQSCQSELANTLTHELGHLHGLEHPCLAVGDPPRVDDLGQPVPDCQGDTDPKIVDATMYNFQTCGETKKETLSADDINGICTIYPIANDPKTCAHVSSTTAGCCSATEDRPGGPFALAGLTVAALAMRRKKSRPR